MDKNKLIHDFLEVVSRGDVELICDHITEVHSVLGNLDFQHPQSGNTPLITAAEENLTEVQGKKNDLGVCVSMPISKGYLHLAFRFIFGGVLSSTR